MHQTIRFRKFFSFFASLALALSLLPLQALPVQAAGTVGLTALDIAYTQDLIPWPALELPTPSSPTAGISPNPAQMPTPPIAPAPVLTTPATRTASARLAIRSAPSAGCAAAAWCPWSARSSPTTPAARSPRWQSPTPASSGAWDRTRPGARQTASTFSTAQRDQPDYWHVDGCRRAGFQQPGGCGNNRRAERQCGA